MLFTPEARHAAVLQVITGTFGEHPSHLLCIERGELAWKPADEPLRDHLQKHIQRCISGSRDSIHLLHGWCVQATIARLLEPKLLEEADWEAVMTMARSAQHTVVVPSIQVLADKSHWFCEEQSDSFWASRIVSVHATSDDVIVTIGDFKMRMDVDGMALMRGMHAMDQKPAISADSVASTGASKFSLFRLLGLVREPH